jgi:TRAP-type uncharacterized transport system substrate-binding protein
MPNDESVHREDRVHKIFTRTTIGIIVAVFILVSLIFKPGAPNEVVLLTGPEGSSYHALGRQYERVLERSGMTARVVETAGGLDNIRRIAAGSNDTVAFAPSNTERAAENLDVSHLESLGSVSYEPLWVFYRDGLEMENIRDLAGMKLATGSRGSVANFLARKILEANDIGDQVTHVDADLDDPQSVTDLAYQGPFDVVFITGSHESPIIAALIATDQFELMSIERADAYAARSPGLVKLVAPQGVFDLADNVPSEDSQLLSTTTTLVADKDLHPAIVPFMLRAASEIHGGEFMFGNHGAFPNRLDISLPLAPAAARYYDQGESGISKAFPYRIARWINYLGLVVIPLLVVAVFVVKVLPVVLKAWVTIRLSRLYKQLEAVEKADAARRPRTELLTMLQEIDDASAGIFVPRTKLPEYIDFRQFLHDMRDRIASGSERELK